MPIQQHYLGITNNGVTKRYKLMLNNKQYSLFNVNKPYYCEVEYIQNHAGQERIDTGVRFNPSKDLEVEMYLYLPSDDSAARWFLFGNYINNTNYVSNFEIIKADNQMRMYLNKSAVDILSSEMVDYKDKLVKFTFTHTAINGYYSMNLDSNSLNTTYTEDFYSSNTPNIALFKDYRASTSPFGGFKLYRCKIMQEGIVIRDYIPVLDWDMTPCLYDKITNTLAYNTGTGDFSYGRQIHYVDYIENTNEAYIDMGLTPTNTMGLNIDYAYTSNDGGSAGITGNYQASSLGTLFITTYSGNTTANGYLGIYHRGGTYHSNNSLKPEINKRYNVKINWLNNSKIIIDDTYESNTGTQTIDTHTLRLFGRYYNNVYSNTKAKIFRAQYSENSTIIKDFNPAIDENNVAFMFERINHIIYDNAGSGSFAYGT